MQEEAVMYEYTEVMYMHHRRKEGLEKLNALGPQGWAPAFQIGKTLILYRRVGAGTNAKPLPEADIEDWREIYPTLTDEELTGIDADDVAEVMGERFELPTRATLNRWAQEARESV